ncbi:MAG: four helix bundle protein [Planctomycetaceae bacterium]|nr:four helix bundle protein [Planctomycetaceae bacterium]
MAVRNYRDLILWQKAMDLVELVYHLTSAFPQDELYGLRSQLRRASVSIPSNIAEGEGRDSAGDFVRFLAIANGSRREVETQAMIAQRLGYITEQQCSDVLALASEVGRLRQGLVESINGK